MKKLFILLGISLTLTSCSDSSNNIRQLFKKNEAVIYSINIRNFAAQDNDFNKIIEIEKGDKTGNFVNAKAKLTELKKYGVNTLHLFPITPTGKMNAFGQLGSVYALNGFNEIAPELDDLENPKTVFEEAKEFIDEAHKLGLYVILDLPCCGAYDLSLKRPELFITNEKKETLTFDNWKDVRLFRFFNKDGSLNNAIVDSSKTFIDMALDLGADGIRADVAAFKPPEFWKKIIKYARKKNKNFFFLAEADVEWTNPSPDLIERYSTVEELLEVGFDSYFAAWSGFNYLTKKEQFDTRIYKNQNTIARNKGKSHISAFATHDKESASLYRFLYWDMILWLNATLPSNLYFLDGFVSGEKYIYPYTGKKASKTYTDDEYYFTHHGKFDIFNFAPPAQDPFPYLKEKYLRAIDFRKQNQNLIQKGKFSLLETENENVFAYSITNKNKELIVIGSLNKFNHEKARVFSKHLKNNGKLSTLNAETIPTLNGNIIEASLFPSELQVYVVNKDK